MNFPRIRTVVSKEWAEVFKNRFVLFTVIFLPLLFTALPIIFLVIFKFIPDSGGDLSDLPPSFMQLCGPMSPNDCMQYFMMQQFLLMYMIMPLAIPVAIAAYSVVGEKTTRSLEPLLATPITTIELLIAKAIAAVVPAILATWAGFAVFVVVALFLTSGPVFALLLSGVWPIAVFLVGPLMAVMAVNAALIVSSRVNDPRAAEQISMVVIVPILGVLFGQIAGVLVLSVPLMLVAALLFVLLDAMLIYVGAHLFEREYILTKWK